MESSAEDFFSVKKMYSLSEDPESVYALILRILFNHRLYKEKTKGCRVKGIFLYRIFTVIFSEVQTFLLAKAQTASNVLIHSKYIYNLF